jgi:hypothetical protein
MATPFSDIYDLFLVLVQDTKLIDLYNQSLGDFEIYLQGFLMPAITDFDNCEQNLEVYSLTSSQFTATLTLKEKNILAKLMVIQWLLKEIQNVSQMNLHLNDTDFKRYSEAQNLREKSEYYNRLREIVNQDMVDYGLKNTPWTEWIAGNFFD